MRRKLAARGADLILLTVRELRLLLGLLLILFVTSETWRYVGRLDTVRLLLLAFATVAAAALVVGLGLRRTLDASIVGRAALRIGVAVVTFGAGLFLTLVVVGVVSVDADLAAEWSGGTADVLVSLSIGGPPLVVTRQLLQVAAFLSSLGALVLAVEVITDAGTRHTLIADLVVPADDDPAEELHD